MTLMTACTDREFLLNAIAVEPGAGCLEETARGLREVANRVGLELTFTGYATVAESLTKADWQAIVAESTRLLVNSAFAAHHIHGVGATPSETRDQVFRRVRTLNPVAMMLLEPDSDHLNPDFASRYVACRRYFGTIFGLVDRLPIDERTRSAVQLFFAREIEDILANAEETRAERHETAAAWAARLERTGYTALKALPYRLPAAVDAVAIAAGASAVDLVVDGVGLASMICALGDAEGIEWVDTLRPGERVFDESAAAPRAADVMQPDATTIRFGSSLREAARLFKASGASDLIVVGADGGFGGVLSEGDLIRAMIPARRVMAGDPSQMPAEHLLRNGRDRHDDRIDALVIRDPMVLSLDDDLLRAADIMVLRQIRRLPVVADRRVVGSVSRADLCEVLFGR